jgi:hypothetical protein
MYVIQKKRKPSCQAGVLDFVPISKVSPSKKWKAKRAKMGRHSFLPFFASFPRTLALEIMVFCYCKDSS